MRKLILSLSYILHPIFGAIFGAICYFWLGNSGYTNSQIYVVYLQFFIITVCIPITIYFLLQAIGKVDSVMVSNASQRKLPLLFQIFLLLVLVTTTKDESNLTALHCYLIGGMISAIIAFIMLFYNFKASLHLIGISSLTLFVIGLSIQEQVNYLIIISVLFILNGLVATSRLLLKAHSIIELFVGFCIGVLSQIISWMLL